MRGKERTDKYIIQSRHANFYFPLPHVDERVCEFIRVLHYLILYFASTITEINGITQSYARMSRQTGGKQRAVLFAFAYT